MREFLTKIGWLSLQYMVSFYVMVQNRTQKLLLLNIFFLGLRTALLYPIIPFTSLSFGLLLLHIICGELLMFFWVFTYSLLAWCESLSELSCCKFQICFSGAENPNWGWQSHFIVIRLGWSRIVIVGGTRIETKHQEPNYLRCWVWTETK